MVAVKAVIWLAVRLIGIGASFGQKGKVVLEMAKRHELSYGVSQSMFTRNAMRVHPFNANVLTGPGGPMRGGIRL